MKLYIAGGCSEHGRNSFLLTGKGLHLLVDAGKMKEKPDEPYPELSDEQIGSIDYLFLTHSHTDHTGAIPYLMEHGFRGTVVAAEATFAALACEIPKRLVLEELGDAGTEIRLQRQLHVRWGRSGHCVGSVWYRIRLGKKKILFTGDYEERSWAYRCDRIRGVKADLAVVDCAYGTEKEDAKEHRRALEEYLDAEIPRGKPMLFPVPSHGRGFDVVKLLSDRGVTCVLSKSLSEEYTNSEHREFWLKKSFTESVEALKKEDIGAFEEALSKSRARGSVFPRKYVKCGILVRDSQLYKEVNRSAADAVADKGGRIVLTGKQDPKSYARKLLDEGRADFYRISVHQNISEMKRLVKKNRFGLVVPYHCREALHFDEKNIFVLSPGDVVKF